VGPHPAVAAVRLGVRRGLAGLPADALVLAACSGGADSLALAAALAFEAPRLGLRAGGVTVDHGLQAGSAAQTERVITILAGLGLDPVRGVKAAVPTRPVGRASAAMAGRGSGATGKESGTAARRSGTTARRSGAAAGERAVVPGRGSYPGPEAAARSARYAALGAVADELGAAVILLGHTMDDQAETVLLGLARGSGARSLAGMAPVAGRYRRPLLGLRREQTTAACAAAGLQAWEDPHNSDSGYARVRVRTRILPLLEELLGPGVTEALARTADQLRADADALDGIAAERAVSLLNAGMQEPGSGLVDGCSPDGAARDGRAAGHGTPGGSSVAADGPPETGACRPEDRAIQTGAIDWRATDVQPLDTAELAALPPAIRTRLLRMAAIAAGSPAGALTAKHVADMDALVTGWHGQSWIDLPGGVRCRRRHDRLHFSAGA